MSPPLINGLVQPFRLTAQASKYSRRSPLCMELDINKYTKYMPSLSTQYYLLYITI